MKKIIKPMAMFALLAALLASTVWALPETLIPGGRTIGLQLQTQGVSIVDFAGEAKAAGLEIGDVLCKINGKEITNAQELSELVAKSNGEELIVTVERDGKEQTLTLKPQKTAEGFRLGVYVRDSINGIGTITYFNPENDSFGALGHGVNNADAKLVPIREGKVCASRVAAILRGKCGEPGALQGALLSNDEIGTIHENTAHGIFGIMPGAAEGQSVPVARAEEIHTGEAIIFSNVSGTEVKQYSINVVSLYPNDENCRNMLIEVTDPALLSQTGGIVQGMSGSPILQDGKLIGAVTHVLVNEPTQGYGIFIENMLNAAQTDVCAVHIDFVNAAW
ncbi:MAG: SpoIVB peptidase [Oscillospiraceae bacterium]|jgi:stage IV sporulation protein B|nr:SpoIVB peptidase [Oscillospiraceae bacterium]